jgi:lysophospholipase L1-like esterase
MTELDRIKRIIKHDYDRKVKNFISFPKSCDLLIVGDSIVHGIPSQYQLCQQGIPGDTTEGVLRRIDAIKAYQPKTVILHVGTNDAVLSDLSIEASVMMIQKIVDALLPIKVIVGTPMPVVESMLGPLEKARTNDYLYAFYDALKHTSLQLIDFYTPFLKEGQMDLEETSDGLHLNDKGYEKYISLLKSSMTP